MSAAALNADLPLQAIDLIFSHETKSKIILTRNPIFLMEAVKIKYPRQQIKLSCIIWY